MSHSEESRMHIYIGTTANCESDDREIECVLHYAERNMEQPVTAGLYDIETTVCIP